MTYKKREGVFLTLDGSTVDGRDHMSENVLIFMYFIFLCFVDERH